MLCMNFEVACIFWFLFNNS